MIRKGTNEMTANKIASAIDSDLRSAIEESTPTEEERQELDSLLDLFIKYKNAGAPKSAIKEAMGLSEDEYVKLNSREEVKSAIISAESKRLETSSIMDEGWDVIENTAMGIVLEAVKYSKDPEYSLKAAAVANKAIRRRREDAKLAYQNQGAGEYQAVNNIAVLSLPKIIVNSIKNQSATDLEKQIEMQLSAVETQKYVDVADVPTTNRLLNVDSTSGMETAKLLDTGEKTQLDYLMEGLLDGKFANR